MNEELFWTLFTLIWFLGALVGVGFALGKVMERGDLSLTGKLLALLLPLFCWPIIFGIWLSDL